MHSELPAVSVRDVTKTFRLFGHPADRVRQFLSLGLGRYYKGFEALKGVAFDIPKGETVGIIGRNGTGKSTFLNIITGAMKPDSGKVDTGETVHFGYYRQEGISFDEGQTVIEALQDIAEVVTMADGSKLTAGQLLSHFLFPPSRQHDYIEKLSGGEKRRLYLTTVLMRNPNFLILDEPTNDLDIETLNVLEDYLAKAGICLLAVSHDRFFIDKIADHIFVFEGDGVIRDFPGNYTQYRNELKREGDRSRMVGRKERSFDGTEEKSLSSTGQQPAEEPPKKKLSFKEKRELEQIEKEIESLENERAEIEQLLSGGSLTTEELHKHSARHAEITAALDSKSDRWLELSERA